MNEDEAELKSHRDDGGKAGIIHPSSFRLYPCV